MSYYQQVLQPDEKVLYVGKLHWIIFTPVPFVFVLGLVLLACGRQDGNHIASLGVPVGSFLLLASVFLFLRSFIMRKVTEIVVTDKRVILKKGLIMRDTTEMNLSKVESVDVLQPLLGRALNYGTILIRGTGGTYEAFDNVGSPLEFRKAVPIR